MILSIVTSFILFLSQVLGAKIALIAVIVGIVTSVILAVKVAVTAIIQAIPYTPLPAEVIAASASLLPENTGTCVELMINARVLLIIYDAKWIYIKTVMQAMSMKIV